MKKATQVMLSVNEWQL